MINSMHFVSEQVKRVDVQFAVTDIYCMDECSKYVFNVHTNISSVFQNILSYNKHRLSCKVHQFSLSTSFTYPDMRNQIMQLFIGFLVICNMTMLREMQ